MISTTSSQRLQSIKAPEEFQIVQWIKRKSQEFDGHLLNHRVNKSKVSACESVRLAVLIEKGQHFLANIRAQKIVEQYEQKRRAS